MRPEVWGGLECTINRTQDEYADQFERTGQYAQLTDLQKACDLGITRLRFPILWERHYNNPEAWLHTGRQLDLLAANGVEPIAGLLHHGGGPAFTDLTDPEFPVLFAAYARKVAIAFPQINYYTPINEPLTTARFSGLYGFWYPHGKDDATFARTLINQLKAIVLAMQAIREVNPDAQLIQTEDLCKVHSTTALQYQADFENSRRWWTYDFLSGRVTPQHPAWHYCTAAGIDETDLNFFCDHICVPDIAGFNYHVTSERYLDDRVEDYLPGFRGGNGRDVYVDTEAVRSGHAAGLRPLLTEAWERYHLPMAITECHLSCTREQQLRWLGQQWDIVKDLDANSFPIVAITAWTLAGAYDWNSLLTQKDNHYEAGVFLTDQGEDQLSALAHMILALAEEGEYDHPALPGKGWWDMPDHKPAYAQTLIVFDVPFMEGYCAQRKLHALYTDDLDDLRAMIFSEDAWAVVSGAGHEAVAIMCMTFNIPLLVLHEDSN
ncbi:MAG: glycosyl hydrolase family protein, partial [Sphingobacteriales bacterium]